MPVDFTRARAIGAISIALVCFRTPAFADQDAMVAECVQHAETAQELRAQGDLQAARAALTVCSRAQCPAVVRQDCTQWTNELAQPSAAITLEAVNEFGEPMTDVFVLVDGEEEPVTEGRISVAPGRHVMRIEAENRIAVLKTVDVPEQSEVVVQATLLPITDADADAFEARAETEVPRPDGEGVTNSAPVWPWLAAGVGVAGYASFAYFGLTGKAETADLREQCGNSRTCNDEQVGAVQSKLTIADVSLGVGLLATGVAIWGFVSGAPSSSEEDVTASTRGTQAPALTARGNSVVAQWQF